MIKIACNLPALVVRRSTLVLIAFLFSLFTLTLALARPVHALTPCQSTQSTEFSYGGVIDDVNKCAIRNSIFDDKIFNWNQIVGTADSLNVLITGRSLNHPETDSITADAGALAGISRGIALAYAVPPASGVEYFADKIHDFNPVKPAYAQTGIGFTALSPVKEVWGAFRNASYVAFIIVFVIMGFMIMFRAHISPQAVATVQDSIPRIVIALILVTFSYAIAGLMIDLMYVVINLAIAVLGTVQGFDRNSAQNVFKENIFMLIFGGWPELVADTSQVIGDTLKRLFNFILEGTGCGVFNLGGCAGKAIAWILGWVGGIILGIALLYIMVKVFFMLLTAYIMIIILTIFAPFFFLVQALPGRNGASEWFKQMIANIAVFPAVVIMFLLAGLLGGIAYYGGSDQGALVNPQNFNESFRPPLLTGGITADTLGKLIAIGIVLATPTAAETVKNFLGVKGGPGLGAGAAAVGAAAGAVGGAGRYAWGGGGPIADYRRRRQIEKEEGIRLDYAKERAKEAEGGGGGGGGG